MDAFESVIASLLQRQGFWTLPCFKVDLTKEEKRKIGRPSAPRWELDIVAYRGGDHELRVVECKSFLDSAGVQCAAFDGTKPTANKRYKLFCDAQLRRIVLRSLEKQLVGAGFCRPEPRIVLSLAAGKICGDAKWLGEHFAKKGWILMGPEEIRNQLSVLASSGYENSVTAVVTKVLLRKEAGHRRRLD